MCQRQVDTYEAPSRYNEEVFATLAEARAVIELWRQDYNQVRPHSALGGLTPETVRPEPRGRTAAPLGKLRRPAAPVRERDRL